MIKSVKLKNDYTGKKIEVFYNHLAFDSDEFIWDLFLKPDTSFYEWENRHRILINHMIARVTGKVTKIYLDLERV